MKTAGIIAEYNPFHNGHAYHLNRVRQCTDADYLIIVMSGNFMQRGVPAILDKYSRARMALENGADLVLELPCLFACSSAELFAKGGVSLLHQLGVVDFLGFGCENDDLPLLKEAASILFEEPEAYRLVLQQSLREGNSFPVARSMALSACMQKELPDSAFFSSPNNILAMEYLKALRFFDSTITPVAIRRTGAAYHEDTLCPSYSSALAIRNTLLAQEDTGLEPEALLGQVPDSVLLMLKQAYQKTYPITTRDFSKQLHYKLLLDAEKGYTEYLDVSKNLSDKIKKNLHSYTNFDSFCMLLKSKELTYTRICRCLLHILLDIRKKDLLPAVPYARVLGFRENAKPLLKELGANSRLPLLTVAADAKQFLRDPAVSDREKRMLQLDLTASRIYTSAVLHQFQVTLPDEFGAPLLKV